MKMDLPSYMITPNCRRWLLWRSEPRLNSNGKPRKTPYYANGKRRSGTLDTPEDYAHLVTFDEANTVLADSNHTGLGFALGPDNSGGYWQGIDLDNVWQKPELHTLPLPGYVEISPSGNGLHAIGYGRPFSALGSNSSGIEAYSKGRYFTVTGMGGEAMTGRPIPEQAIDIADFVQQQLLPLHSKHIITTFNTSAISTIPLAITPELIANLKSALQYIPADDYHEWIAIGHALHNLGDPGFTLWAEWSATSTKHNGDSDLARWKTFTADRTRYAAVFARAQRAGWVNPHRLSHAAAIFGDQNINNTNIITPAPNILIEVSIADVFTNPPETPKFLIESLFPKGVLTLLGAHGGTGKSLLALQAAICLAIGHQFMGKMVTQSRVLFYSAEDNSQIIRHRLVRLCQHMNIEPSVLSERLKIIDATDNPSLFEELNVNGVKQGIVTTMYHHLHAEIERFGADTLIIDNASDTFDANENERARVRGFIRALVRLGKTRGTAVLLLAHIDKLTAKGIGHAEGYSGSTAWHNSARSRLFLTAKDDGLVLEHQKSNLGKRSEPIYLRWNPDGILIHVATVSEQVANETVLRLIGKYYERGDFISSASNSRNNAYKILRPDPDFPASLTREKLTTILREAENTGQLQREEYITEYRKPQTRYKVAPTAPSNNG